MAKEVHTVKTPKGWANKLPGGKVLSNHRKKETATQKGRSQAKARKAEHVYPSLGRQDQREEQLWQRPTPQ